MSIAQPPVDESAGDAELITAVRGGARESYAMLYERHRAAAYHLSRQLVRSPAEADDLVSDAFAKVLDTLLAGGGPDTAFRAYLLTTLRNGFYDRIRRDQRVELTEDMSTVDPGVPFVDTAVAGLETTLAARAFARLPERWQTVLWHTEIEGESPAQVAPLLGLTPNGVAALAYRAREGLRQAYLQVHLAETADDVCRTTVERLGAWARDGLSRRERAQVDGHLAECERCRALAAELVDVNHGLRGIVAVLVLGSATVPYLAGGAAAKGAALAWAGATGAAGAAGAGAAGATAGAAAGKAAAAGTWIGRALKTPGGQAGAAVVAVAAVGAMVAGVLALTSTSQPEQIAEPPAAEAPIEPPAAAEPPANPPAEPAQEPPAQAPAQEPPAPAPQPEPPAPDQPAPEQPAPPAEQPAPPPAEQPEPPPTQAEPPPEQPQEPEEPPPPAPAITTDVDPASANLPPGGSGVVPLRMTNTGGQPSGPVSASVPQPPGVEVCGVEGTGWSTDATCTGAPSFAATALGPEAPHAFASATTAGQYTGSSVRQSPIRPRAEADPATDPAADTAVDPGLDPSTPDPSDVASPPEAADPNAVTLVGPDLAPGQSTTAYLRLRVNDSMLTSVPITVTLSWPGIAPQPDGAPVPGSTQATVTFTVTPSKVPTTLAATGNYGTASAGNTLLTCDPVNPACALAQQHEGPLQDNSNYLMTNYAGAGDPPSSAAVLDVPDGSEVVWAGLYWSASGSAAPGPATLTAPDATTSEVAAQTQVGLPLSGGFQAYADVTTSVQSGGQYTVRAAPTAAGEPNVYAGWALVAVYADPSAPVRSILVSDEPTTVGQQGSVDVAVPAGAATTGTVGLVLWEGDTGPLYTSDQASFGGVCVDDIASSHAAGAVEGPDWNTFGVDVRPDAFVDVPLADPTLSISTGYDGFTVGVVVVSAAV